MLLFIKATNFMCIGILENGLFILIKIVPESIEIGVRIPQRSNPKELVEFTNIDKEFLTLDTNLTTYYSLSNE